ncbi:MULTISPECIES: GNAT family N-acetyltransferase [unclassified Pseudoclavibacter]|uniref:GNAT family N-acetyltransferase n=1 Tax=unclassified Pseudoclavibacter TaxID=2615177 RepID=UPI001BA9F5B3|nr:GNAT family N-acetyltransferase [Pseudoclavibacter sp. Marseille-Q4354]MBS3180341.1 GNAT family N-acetyltransferase [Pseudoclavibacter sp. Marseille-Q4354]
MTQTAPVATQDARATLPAVVRVREARPADWSEVVRVSEAAFAAGPYGHLPVGEERQRLVRDVEGRAAAGSVLVAERLTERRAEQASEILGTLSIARAGTGPSRLAVADEAEVRLLAVSPTAQRLGVARRLMLAASETALGWGASALVLDTGDRNFAAQALYEGLGYRRTNEPGQPGVASEGRIPHVDYRLQLQPAPGVVVRLVRPSEVDAVAELSLRAYDLEYSISGSYRDDIISVGERAAAHQVWVAVDPQSGELLGSVATPKPGEHLTSLPQREDELDFRLLAVDPSARGRGVGAALTTLVIELARLRGLRRVVMNSGPQMVRAHRLYERLGFSILESRVRTVDPGDGRAPFQLLAFSIDV